MVRDMKKTNFIKVLTLFIIIFSAFESYAFTVNVTGKSAVLNNQLRAAYHNAVNNALLTSIKWYYKENNQSVDVDNEYIKFIKSYSIVSQELIDNMVTVKLKVDLDENALQDARILLNQYSDSAVYVFSGIDDSILSNSQIKSTISNMLASQQFSLSNQGEFLGRISNYNDNSSIEKAFNEVKSSNMFIFTFQPKSSEEDFKNGNNACEIVTTVSMNSKGKEKQTVQIITGSDISDTARCYNDAVKKAVNDTISYVREKIVQLPEDAAKLRKYEIKIINASNLVLTKNIIDTLSKRGLIKSSKAMSYTQKSVVFEVQSYFTPEELSNKVKTSKMPEQPIKIDFGSKELVLDFGKE